MCARLRPSLMCSFFGDCPQKLVSQGSRPSATVKQLAISEASLQRGQPALSAALNSPLSPCPRAEIKRSVILYSSNCLLGELRRAKHAQAFFAMFDLAPFLPLSCGAAHNVATFLPLCCGFRALHDLCSFLFALVGEPKFLPLSGCFRWNVCAYMIQIV